MIYNEFDSLCDIEALEVSYILLNYRAFEILAQFNEYLIGHLKFDTKYNPIHVGTKLSINGKNTTQQHPILSLFFSGFV